MAYPYQQLDRPHLHYPGNVSLVPELFPNQPYGGMSGAGQVSFPHGGHYPGQYGPDYGRLPLFKGLGGTGQVSFPHGGHYPGQYGPDYGRLPLFKGLGGMGMSADNAKTLKYVAGAVVAWLGYKAWKKRK